MVNPPAAETAITVRFSPHRSPATVCLITLTPYQFFALESLHPTAGRVYTLVSSYPNT